MKRHLFIVIFFFKTTSFLSQQHTIDSLEHLVKIGKNDITKVKQLLNLQSLINESDPSKFMKYAKQSLSLSHKLRYKIGIKSSLINLGNAYCMTPKNDSGLVYYNKALVLCKKIKDKPSEARCLSNIGIVYFYTSNYTKAITYFLQALKLNEHIGKENQIAQNLNNIAGIYMLQKDYDKGLKYYRRALSIQKKEKNNLEIEKILGNIANIYDAKNDLDLALKYSSKALNISSTTSITRGNNLTRAGQIYYKKEQYEKSHIYAMKAMDIYRKLDYKVGFGNVYFLLANYYFHKKDYKTALSYVQKNISICNTVGDKYSLSTSYLLMSKIYSSMHNFQKAYETHKIYSNTNDSIFNASKSKQIAELQTKYEVEKKNKKILLLRKNKAIMQANISRKNTVIGSLITGTLLVLISLTLFFNRRKLLQQNKYEKALNTQQQEMALTVLKAQEIERQQIARDMHDSVGAYLSSLKINMESLKTNIQETDQKIYSNMSQALQTVTSEIRSLAKNLVSDTLQEYGLYVAIEELVELINQSGKIEVHFSYDNESNFSNIELETSIFRIVQELLNNSLKHAQASLVNIRLSDQDHFVKVYFSDNGKGFDYEEIVKQNKGIGLQNIQARVHILKGSFQAKSNPEEGSEFNINIPKNISIK